MSSLLEAILKTVGFWILIVVIIAAVWLSPIGKFIDEFEEFRKWKRDQGK
jgi:F0F1-type ATP synthase membrane subunit b/b'